MLAALAALPAAFLPYRWWDRFPTIQIERFALLSALLTILAGSALAVIGFFAFLESGKAGGSVQAAAFSTIIFALTTPQGLFSTYLIVSGIFRAATSFVGDWYGDPLLTAVVTATMSSRERTRDSAARAERLRREGIEVPDRLYPGTWAGLPQVELVVVACRRKPDWDAGVVVLTPENTYRLGVPFDQQTPDGLRTVYPLREYEQGSVIRRSVTYELPALRER
jgi:hypothetical protein